MRVIEAGFQDRRGTAVVLGGAEHDDDVRGPSLIHFRLALDVVRDLPQVPNCRDGHQPYRNCETPHRTIRFYSLSTTAQMCMEQIRSAANPLLKEIRRAVSRGEPTERGFCIADTFHLLDEAVRSRCAIQAVLFEPTAATRVERLVPARCAARFIEVPAAVLHSLSPSETPQGVVALVRLEPSDFAVILRFPALAVVLDGVQDPGNAGAIARAAEAFGATGLVFLKGSVSPYHPRTLRASAGSLFRLPFVESVTGAELLRALDQHGVPRWVTVPREATPVSSAPLAEPAAIVIGSESRGSSPALRPGAQELWVPTLRVESLNAAVAAAIVLYEAARQRTES